MLEILNIFYFFLIFILIFSIPFNKFTLNHVIKIKGLKFNFFDYQSLNIIFFCYIILFISFFDLNLKFVFYLYILVSFVLVSINFLKNTKIKKNWNIKNFLFFFLITISIFFYVAHNLKLEWDGHHWLEKVNFFYNENKIENFYTLKYHPEYPHLGSYIWAFFWKNSLVNYEYTGRLFCIYFYTISVFSLMNCMDDKLKKFRILFIIFIVVITFDPYLFSGYQDYFLFSILVVASRLLYFLDFNQINQKLLMLIILSLGLLMWFKDEGLVYFLIFSILLILNIKINLNLKLFYYVSILLIIIFNFIIQIYLLGIYEVQAGTTSNSLKEINILLSNFDTIFIKSYKIVSHSIIASIKYLSWVLIFFSIFLISYEKKIDDKLKYLIQCLVFNLLFLYGAFMTFGAIDHMLSLALDRLFFQISGFYLIIFLLLINKFHKKLSF